MFSSYYSVLVASGVLGLNVDVAFIKTVAVVRQSLATEQFMFFVPILVASGLRNSNIRFSSRAVGSAYCCFHR